MFQGSPTPILLKTGDNLSRMRQCPKERKLIATGGKARQNRLRVWDLSTKTNIFESKNLPNDSLQLEIPIWDNDFRFFDSNTLSTCSRYGYIRFYDIRAQRRPTLKFQNKEQISFSCMAVHGNSIYVGTTTGGMRAFDSRHLKHQIHTYKGFTGSVTDIEVDENGKFICSSSLDRYVRVHNTESTGLMYQNYLKSKGTAILIKSGESKSKNDQSDSSCVIVENGLADEEALSKEGSDYDELFDNMEKIEHDRNEVPENENHEEPQNKKRKINNC